MKRWILGIVIIALVGAWVFIHRGPVDGNAAVLAIIDGGEVNVSATPVSPTEVRITVTRQSLGSDPVKFVVAAGTVIYPSSASEQRMVIATPLAVELNAGEQSREYTAEAYCLDQFLDPPAFGSNLAFRDGTSSSDDGERVVSDSGIKLGELMPCLDQQQGNHTQRQFALWLVEGNYFDRTPSDAEAEIAQKYESKLQEEAEAELRGEFRRRFLARVPGAAADAVDRALDDYISRELGPKVRGRAEQMAHKDVAGMREPAVREMLGNCQVETSGKLLFA